MTAPEKQACRWRHKCPLKPVHRDVSVVVRKQGTLEAASALRGYFGDYADVDHRMKCRLCGRIFNIGLEIERLDVVPRPPRRIPRYACRHYQISGARTARGSGFGSCLRIS